MIYDIILDMLKLLFGTLEFLKPYATTVGVIFLILRQNHIRKVINGQLPKRFRDTHESDIQEIKQDLKEIKDHLGVESSNLQLNGQKTTPILSYKRFFLLLQTALNQKRRVSKMREYLKKLGRTKLQAFLLATFINMALLVGYLFNLQDIQSKVDAWMPMVNMLIQLILTIVYQWVEGSIVKANIQAAAPTVTSNLSIDSTATYTNTFSTIKAVHDGINELLKLAKENDTVTLSAYGPLLDIIKSVEQAKPLEVVPDVPNEQVSA